MHHFAGEREGARGSGEREHTEVHPWEAPGYRPITFSNGLEIVYSWSGSESLQRMDFGAPDLHKAMPNTRGVNECSGWCSVGSSDPDTLRAMVSALTLPTQVGMDWPQHHFQTQVRGGEAPASPSPDPGAASISLEQGWRVPGPKGGKSGGPSEAAPVLL